MSKRTKKSFFFAFQKIIVHLRLKSKAIILLLMKSKNIVLFLSLTIDNFNNFNKHKKK